MNHYLWKFSPPAKPSAEVDGLPPLIVQLLHNRGVTEPTEVELFLAADEHLQSDPLLLPDMEKAVVRTYQALLSGENIAIYGDFDADGICGTAILVQALSFLGGKAVPYIPHRHKEGYGLNSNALESLYRQGITLVITVDCGITALPEVEYARRMGLDIIVTDHHSIPPLLPQALAIVNPQRKDCAYPFSQLAGAGVAFKFAQALFRILGREEYLEELLDLVALGTVADLVPLLGENRYLVKRGLQMLNKTKRIGLQEQVKLAGLQLGNLDTEAISWVLAPRLNATGRLDYATTSYKLLVSDSPQEAHDLAQELERKNAERRRLTEKALSRAREQLSVEGVDSPILMIGGEDYPSGVMGLVAGKLAEEFYRPSVIIRIGQNMSRGSARSIAEFDIIAALGECQDLLSRFGGHPMAAGFSLPTENLASFQQRLLDIAANQLFGLDLRPFLTIEAEPPLATLGGETFQAIERLAPFGRANPLPNFLTRGVKVVDCRQAGSKGEHLKLKLREDDIVWHGIGFTLGNLIAEVTPYVDLVYNLRVERWGEEEVLELNILDFAPSEIA